MTPSRHSPARALLICNGEPPSRALARCLAARADTVVAADGGANAARALGLRPDVIVGDLDSITPATRRHFSGALLLQVDRQDNTDLEKALDYLRGTPVREVVITGATGRRIDFTLANLAVLWRYAARFLLTVAGDGWYAVPARRTNRFEAPCGTTVSLVPYGRVTGITLGGLRYPLRDAALRTEEAAVSNVVVRSRFSVSLRAGRLLIIVQQDLSLAPPPRRGSAR